MSELIFAQDWSGIDASKVDERNDPIHGPVTVFRDVVIAREIVHPYEVDGKILFAYKSADELERYWPWVDGRWAIAGRHPSTPVIVSSGDIAGRTVNPRFVKSLKDSKTGRPNIRGILVDLEVFNDRVSPDTLRGMLDGTLTDVSIGFLYGKEMHPGNWNGYDYDFRQVNMFHDHTAFGIRKGRCAYPACGIGADEVFQLGVQCLNGETGKIGMINMPWEETDEYIRSGHGSTDCDRMRTDWISEDQGIKAIFCFKDDESSIQSYLFSKDKGWTMEKAKTWFSEHEGDMSDVFLGRLAEISLKASDQEPTTDEEKAMTHYDLTKEVWDSLSAKAKTALIAALPEEPAAGEGADAMTEEELKAKIVEVQKKLDDLYATVPEEETEERAAYEVLYAELTAYTEALTELIKAKVLTEEAPAVDEVARSKRLIKDPRFKIKPVFE